MEYTDSVDRFNRILVRAHRIIQKELLKQGVDDLVPSHGAVLEYLSQAGMPQPVTELVVALKRPKSSITKATDCLEHGGYVFKKPNPGDGRSYLVGLTPSGRDVLEHFRAAYSALEKKLFASISDERRDACLQTLGEMENNLERFF
ncbi:MarR family winged helix-turn-helix transcriptional regulator [Mailhella sp.]|uniref:MarR family winged helix-turn-helix transcriptional regulator n=1 Tax=Mailhella sp. TaxID=1981029 RepID=UPI003AB48323